MLWIKSIFVFHGTYLMGVPGIKKRLFLLRHLLDNRSASYKRILKLRGRLDLVLRHAQDISQNKMDFSQAQVPLVEVYESSMIPKEEEEEEDAEEEDGDEDMVNVDFGFSDPKPAHFKSIRNFLRYLLMGSAKDVDFSPLADAVVNQVEAGSIVEVNGEEDAYAFLTVLHLQAYQV